MPQSSLEMIDHASQRRPLARLIAFLLEIPGILALLGLTVALVCYPTAARLQLDRSVTSMFDPADQTRLDYQELQDAFGGNAIAILVYSDDGLFSIEGLNRNQAISQQVLSIKGVKGILSPSKLNEAIEQLRPAGLLTGFSKKVPGLLRQTDEVARQIDRDFAGYTHSADRMRGGVVAMLDPGYRDATIGELKELTSQLPAQYPGAIIEAALVGEPVLVHDAFALIERDGARLATFTVGLLSLVLAGFAAGSAAGDLDRSDHRLERDRDAGNDGLPGHQPLSGIDDSDIDRHGDCSGDRAAFGCSLSGRKVSRAHRS